MKIRRDPELYARLTTPRPRADVDAALSAFDDELYALRAKHGIADLTVVAGVSVETDDGPKVIVATSHYGHQGNALCCVGAAFAQLRAEQDAETLAMAGIVRRPRRAKRP
jgi:hypothetical protein